jgi:hypothetical protein
MRLSAKFFVSNLLKTNILYPVSRRAVCQAQSQNARGECPQLFHRQTCPMSPEVAENQYFISDVAAGYLPGPEPELAGRIPPTFPPPNLSAFAKTCWKSIFYIRCRGGLSAQPGAESRGRLPRTDPRQAPPLSPKTAENQYFIFVVAAGICPARGRISRAAAPNRPPPSPAAFAKNCWKPIFYIRRRDGPSLFFLLVLTVCSYPKGGIFSTKLHSEN